MDQSPARGGESGCPTTTSNTAGAVGDCYLLARLAIMPEGTLLSDANARHVYVFYPDRAE